MLLKFYQQQKAQYQMDQIQTQNFQKKLQITDQTKQ